MERCRFSSYLTVTFLWLNFFFVNLHSNGSELIRILENKSESDSMRIVRLQTLVWNEYLYVKSDSALYIADLIHDIARKNNSTKDITLALNMKGVISHILTKYVQAEAYYKESMRLSDSIDNKFGLSSTLGNLGTLYGAMGDNVKANEYHLRSKQYCQVIGDTLNYINALGSLGQSFSAMGDYTTGFDYYFEALELWERLDYPVQAAVILGNIGENYLKMGNYELAEEFLTRSLSLSDSNGYEYEIHLALYKLARFYLTKGDYQNALSSFKKCYDFSLKIEDAEGQIAALQAIGEVYTEQDSIKQALESFEIALQVSRDVGRTRDIATNFFLMGKAYARQKNHSRAIEHYKKCLDMAQQQNYMNLVEDVAFALYEVYRTTAYDGKALEMYQLGINMRDSIKGERNQILIQKKHLEYEFDKEEAKRQAEFDQASALQQAEIIRQKQVRNLSIAGGLLVLLIGGAWFMSYQKKQLIKLKLVKQQKEMERQKAYIEAQEDERTRIAKELHDGLASSLAGIRMGLVNIDEKNTVIDQMIDELGTACKEVRTISHNLMPSNMMGTGFVEVVRNYVIGMANSNSFDISFEAYPEQALNDIPEALQMDIYRIIQELINNANKHAQATKLDVTLMHEDGMVSLLVEDDGVGFSDRQVRDGIGLKNIDARIKNWKGELIIDAQEGRGSTFIVKIKVA